MNWDELIEQRNWKRIKSLLLADHSRTETHKAVGYVLQLMAQNDVEAVEGILTVLGHWKLSPYVQLEGKKYCLGSVMRPSTEVKIQMMTTVLSVCDAAKQWQIQNPEIFLRTVMDLHCIEIFNSAYALTGIQPSHVVRELLIYAANSQNLEAFKSLFAENAQDPDGVWMARACRSQHVALIEFLLPYSNIKKAQSILYTDYPDPNRTVFLETLQTILNAKQHEKITQVVDQNESLATKTRKM